MGTMKGGMRRAEKFGRRGSDRPTTTRRNHGVTIILGGWAAWVVGRNVVK
jgi:hypothetical protein